MSDTPGAIIEIVERGSGPDPNVLVPNEVWLDGKRLMCLSEAPIIEAPADGSDAVRVTFTVIAKRVTIGYIAGDA